MSWSVRDEAGAREFFDPPEAVQAGARRVAQYLRTSTHAIAFTGAGISTAAGVPDFRSGMNTKLKTGPGLLSRKTNYKGKAALPLFGGASYNHSFIDDIECCRLQLCEEEERTTSTSCNQQQQL